MTPPGRTGRRSSHRADDRAGHRLSETRLRYRIVSLLLRYPDEHLPPLLDDISAALPAIRHRADRHRLAAVTERLRRLPLDEAARQYADTFDHTGKRTLYLTWYQYGDTRARGMALLALKRTYRSHGHPPPETELPDFLPLVLEFASLAPEPGGRILTQYRPALELLRGALHQRNDPYGALLDVVCSALPKARPWQRERVRRLAAEGPPTEQVGLEPRAGAEASPGPGPLTGTGAPAGPEPFAPPEYLAAPAHLTGRQR